MIQRSASRTSDFKLLESCWREPVERTVLANGLTLILKPDRSAALASVQVWVRTGSQHEGEFLGAGLSHFLEHMLFKGTERRAGREISMLIQRHGGHINAYTTFDRTVYYADLPAEHVAVAIDILADAVLHSRLPEEEVEREREVILREIAMTHDDPDNRFWETLFATAFRDHPYRHPIIGYRDVFAEVSREALVTYYRERYVPNNLTVVIVGDVDPVSVRAQVAEHFGAAARGRLGPVLVPDEAPPLARREQHRFEDVEISRGGLAWQIPGLTHPDAPALDLLATVLGAGESSVLWRSIREKAGLVHAIDAQSWNPGRVGLFCVSFTCDPDRRESAARAVEATLSRCASQGFPERELRRARRQLVVGEINTRKTMAGQASRLGAAEVVVGDLDFSRSWFGRLGEIGSKELQQMVRRYLVPSRATSVSLNPRPATMSAGPSIAARPAPGDFEELRFRNGTRLLLQPDSRRPNLHLRLLCLGGPPQEEPARRGASALLATLLTKDTRRRSAAAVARTVEEVGGVFQAFSGNNSLGLALEMLAPDASRALDILSEAMLAPIFQPAAFRTERAAQVAELLQDADDIVSLGRKLVRRRFFGGHPLALDAQGDLDGVRALKPADLATLWRRLAVGPNIVLAVTGDFSSRDLKPRLRELLDRLPGTATSARTRRKARLPAEPGEFVEIQPREQAVVFQAFPSPSVVAPDFHVGEVADELFSGMASRLFERVREERGLAYFVRSHRINGLDAGMFCFFAGTAPTQVPAVLAEIDAEIARVQGGELDEDEVQRCRIRLKAGRRESLQTIGARAMHAGLNSLYGLPVNDWQRYDERIDQVTRDDLARFAQRYFQRVLRTQLVVRP